MPTVQQALSQVPAPALAKASAALADSFGRTLLISTLHQGARLDDIGEATGQDLDALAAALPPEQLSRDVSLRDAASSEPPMLAAIRQAEGAPPRLPAVLLARSDEEAETLLSEASAAGFEPGAAPPRREIGLRGARERAEASADGTVAIGAATGWDELVELADRQGFGVPAGALAGRFGAPLEAAAAGLFGEADIAWFRGEAMSARLPLPPAAVSATDRAWFVQEGRADDLLRRLCDLYEPLYAETIAPLEATMLHASGLLDAAPKGRAILRLVLSGTRPVRAAAMRGADRAVRLRGGTLCARGGLPSEAQVLAILAACGAARLDLADAPAELPPAAILRPRARWMRGRTVRDMQCWYPRDLSRSMDQANDLLAGHREVALERPRADDDGWEALRAALAEALP